MVTDQLSTKRIWPLMRTSRPARGGFADAQSPPRSKPRHIAAEGRVPPFSQQAPGRLTWLDQEDGAAREDVTNLLDDSGGQEGNAGTPAEHGGNEIGAF